MRRDTLRVPGPGSAPSARRQAGAVRRRRAERADQRLAGRGRALGAALPRRVRGRPAQPGHPDPVRADQRAARRVGRALLRRLARSRGADARARRARLHRRRPPPDRGVRRARRQLLHRAGLHQPAHHAGPGGRTAARRPAHRRAPDRPRGRARRVQPGAHRDVRRRGGHRGRRGDRRRDQRRRARVEGRGPSRRARRAAAAAGGRRGLLRPVALRRDLRRRRCTGRGHPDPRARPAPRHQAHHRGPRRLALPEGPARAARRDRARARQRRDLPRLHARLPVLPGRDDHPAGARAVAGRDRRDGRPGRARLRVRRGRACCRSPAPTTPRSPRSPRASPTATRAPTPRSRCPPPASTRSTSTSPTRSAATAAAPGSRSRRRAARSGSAE